MSFLREKRFSINTKKWNINASECGRLLGEPRWPGNTKCNFYVLKQRGFCIVVFCTDFAIKRGKRLSVWELQGEIIICLKMILFVWASKGTSDKL